MTDPAQHPIVSRAAQHVDFGQLLRHYRELAGFSQLALSRTVGVNSGYISRLEAGERASPAVELVQAIAAALNLSTGQADHLLAAAGYLPSSLAGISLDDPTLTLVIRLLTEQTIPADELAEFREIVRLVAHRWLPDA